MSRCSSYRHCKLDLLGALDTNTTLEAIDLSGNMVDPEILADIREVLSERCGSSRSRGLSPNSSVSSNLAATVRRIAANDPNLVEVDLYGCDLVHDPDTEALLDRLSSNTHVRKLCVDNTMVDDSFVAALSLALVDNLTITHLSMRDNRITSEGCEYVSKCAESSS